MQQQVLFDTPSNWQTPNLDDLPSWEGVGRLGIDTETNDPDLRKLGPGTYRNGAVVGVSFAIEDGDSYYLPFGHQDGDNLPRENVLHYLRDNAALFTGQLVGANLAYDLGYLWELGIEFPREVKCRDIQVADPLINELHFSYSLDKIANRHGFEGKDERLLREAAANYGVDPKSGLWKLPARHVGPYAEVDAELPLKILRRQERLIEKNDLWDIWELESSVLPVLCRMRKRGVRIDQDKLGQIEDWAAAKELEALDHVKFFTGISLTPADVWKAAALSPVLSAIGVKPTFTDKGKVSVDAELLKSIDHSVADSLSVARKVNKLRTTFVKSMRDHMVNGRIHCSFKQIAMQDANGETKGARFGRLSCVTPNLQQVPSPDKDPEIFGEFRKIFLPEEGAFWGCNDYSQQEPRWTTELAARAKLPNAMAAAIAYRDDPTIDNHQMMADLTGLGRKPAKNIFLGLCYGEGGSKMCKTLGLPTRWAMSSGRGKDWKITFFETHGEAITYKTKNSGGYIWEAAGLEGQDILNRFDKQVPYVRKLAKLAQERAKKVGVIRTIGGRVLNFPQDKNGNYEWVYKALNRAIQGSSADQMKKAMVQIDKEMPDTFLQLQVHDETDGSYYSMDEANQVKEIMENCITGTTVPFKVDLETGPSWGEIK